MNKHQDNVKKLIETIRFYNRNLPKLPATPTVNSHEMMLAQANLILEEFLEVLEACGMTLTLDNFKAGDTIEDPNTWGLSIGTYKPADYKDLPEIAKELADLSVVTMGMFTTLGIDAEPILEAVDQNNLAKFGPGGYLDENRKWRKPLDHPKPDVAKLLEEQGWDNPNADDQKR